VGKLANEGQGLRTINMLVAGGGKRARVGSGSGIETMQEEGKGKEVATDNPLVRLLD